MSNGISVKLLIWRQNGPDSRGKLEPFAMSDVTPEMSILEMLDLLNEKLIKQGTDPIAFDSDCREGICGTCGFVVDGLAHGPGSGTATCEIRMRRFRDGQTITLEPFRARAFPVIKDLVIDRSAFDRIMSAGGYISANTGAAPDANSLAVNKAHAEVAMDAAACIGCAGCVAACPNGSASLFVGAKVSQYAMLPQGRPEAARRVIRMVDAMDLEGFGDCSNHAECEAVCPKGISIFNIGRMRREYVKALVAG